MAGSPTFLPSTAEAVLDAACRSAGLDSSGATMMRVGENILYRLSSTPVVVRIGRDAGHRPDACKELAVSGWLAAQGFPAARVFEVDCPQPLDVGGHPVTFWRFLPGRPATTDEAGVLGALVRRLHQLPRPAIDLPPVRAFDHVAARLAVAPIAPADRELLHERVEVLSGQLLAVEFALPEVALHGDAHIANVMIDDGAPTLIDFEAFAWGPAEWDLAKTAAEASMGMVPDADYRAFADAYGRDVTEWSGWPVLRGIQQLKMVSWLAQNVDHSSRIRAEYDKRIATIRTGVLTEPWRGL
ncbi:phosphotransferase enzyme family protein [Nocardia jiangsuensis]|uniref:Phosphotransferase enzyme family protein n=1 Tax=Nocardia jiangsuensis TaxID=1691563 RepID=A0ABV8DZY8_9NOCA